MNRLYSVSVNDEPGVVNASKEELHEFVVAFFDKVLQSLPEGEELLVGVQKTGSDPTTMEITYTKKPGG